MSHLEKKLAKPKHDFPIVKDMRWKKALSDYIRWIIAGACLAVSLILIFALIFGISNQSLKKEGKFRKQLCVAKQKIEFSTECLHYPNDSGYLP